MVHSLLCLEPTVGLWLYTTPSVYLTSTSRACFQPVTAQTRLDVWIP